MPSTGSGRALRARLEEIGVRDPERGLIDAIEVEARAEGYAAGLAAAREAVAAERLLWSKGSDNEYTLDCVSERIDALDVPK